MARWVPEFRTCEEPVPSDKVKLSRPLIQCHVKASQGTARLSELLEPKSHLKWHGDTKTAPYVLPSNTLLEGIIYVCTWRSSSLPSGSLSNELGGNLWGLFHDWPKTGSSEPSNNLEKSSVRNGSHSPTRTGRAQIGNQICGSEGQYIFLLCIRDALCRMGMKCLRKPTPLSLSFSLRRVVCLSKHPNCPRGFWPTKECAYCKPINLSRHLSKPTPISTRMPFKLNMQSFKSKSSSSKYEQRPPMQTCLRTVALTMSLRNKIEGRRLESQGQTDTWLMTLSSSPNLD